MDEPLYLKSPVAGAVSRARPGGRDSASSEMLLARSSGAASTPCAPTPASSTTGIRRASRSASDQVAAASASLPDALKESIAFAQTQIRNFAQLQRATLTDFEAETLPGVFLGQRQVPVSSVGAYCPSGRVPMLACAFMTVLVPKVAGVETVIACSPPRGRGAARADAALDRHLGRGPHLRAGRRAGAGGDGVRAARGHGSRPYPRST